MTLPEFTLFSVPKKMRGQNGINQHNAVRSWLELHPRPEILLFGEDAVNDNLHTYYPYVTTHLCENNEYGTPLVSSVFSRAQENSEHEILMYTNADIMFTWELSTVIQKVLLALDDYIPFLVIGRRWDIDIPEELSMGTNWQKWLRAFVYEHGALHQPAGLDYFVFRKGTMKNIPPFAIGRFRWDNWLVWHARQQNFVVIDATDALMAVHLNHDYSHTREGTKHEAYSGEEAQENSRLARDTGCTEWYTTNHATHYLTSRMELLSRE